uniref:Uncharacterized protein n=1 Tax=Panagrolaimus sp. JU765 TaxID=591449 RepID=A0AC34QTA6_9BILA
MPLASLVDGLHRSSNIPTEICDQHKYFLCSIHSLVWLKISVLIGILSMIALASPTFYLIDEYQREISFLKEQKVPLRDSLFGIPSGNYMAWFIFFETFIAFHMIFTIIGLCLKLALLFVPSQIMLFLTSIKLSWDLGYDLYISGNNFIGRLFDIEANDYGVISVSSTESNLAFLSNAELRLVFSAMTKVIMIFLVLFGQLVIERSMQWYCRRIMTAKKKLYRTPSCCSLQLKEVNQNITQA